jgi:omega-6 fatty acid desaturase (delta-12 desaturase)
VAIALHVALLGAAIVFGAVDIWLTAAVVPLSVACALGSYLFYAQHNFDGMYIAPRDEWSWVEAALESSSYFETGRVLGWLTGNIGYHHVHHLNPKIPFYRLPETMANIPALQTPHKTSIAPADVIAGFKLKLWDPKKRRMVPYPRLRG